jgi:hypothetical protein
MWRGLCQAAGRTPQLGSSGTKSRTVLCGWLLQQNSKQVATGCSSTITTIHSSLLRRQSLYYMRLLPGSCKQSLPLCTLPVLLLGIDHHGCCCVVQLTLIHDSGGVSNHSLFLLILWGQLLHCSLLSCCLLQWLCQLLSWLALAKLSTGQTHDQVCY